MSLSPSRSTAATYAKMSEEPVAKNIASIAKTNRLIAGFLIAMFILALIPTVIAVITYAVALDAAKHLSNIANSPSATAHK